MEGNMKENDLITKCMAKESSHGRMKGLIKAIFAWTSNMAKEN
jgi:hypothetical protein